MTDIPKPGDRGRRRNVVNPRQQFSAILNPKPLYILYQSRIQLFFFEMSLPVAPSPRRSTEVRLNNSGGGGGRLIDYPLRLSFSVTHFANGFEAR
jgi:hypothetical protein